MNYRQFYAVKKANQERIRKLCPTIPYTCGIYIWHREDEEGFGRFYAGQAVNLMERSVQHLQQYDHLGLSIKKHGFKSDTNPYGWELEYFTCKKEDLDELEKKTIKEWLKKGMIPYNITSGGQGEGKTDINERKPSKGYYDGVVNGRLQAKRYVKEIFSKYLDFTIKDKSNKIKERKLNEFRDWLNEGDEKNV